MQQNSEIKAKTIDRAKTKRSKKMNPRFVERKTSWISHSPERDCHGTTNAGKPNGVLGKT